MPVLFRRHSSVNCFFCLSTCALPPNPRNFRCSTCGCWNRYDENGDIVSEEPAMHVDSLNANSFAMRASTSQDQLPTMYGNGPFCHTCQSNQLLIINILSNYLPPLNDPEHAARLDMLPEYKESLHVRYPPVCDECLPAVEEEIRRKDQMARTKALGGWLNDSKGKERQRRVSEGHKELEKVTIDIIVWRVRGVLWATSFAIAIFCNLAGALGVRSFFPFPLVQPILPAFVLLSLLWTVWDPTYASFQRAQRQGRDVRVRGKNRYIKMQMTAWFSRLVTSSLLALAWQRPDWDYSILSPSSSCIYFTFCLFVEVTTIIVSCMILRLHQPPAVRLLNTDSHKSSPSRSATPYISTREGTPAPGSDRLSAAADADLLAALSFSSKPILTPTNPVFGRPSLLSAVSSSSAPQEIDADAMDWTPTDSSGSYKSKTRLERDDASWLRPQRFFPPERPTGLEGLFEQTLLVIDDTPVIMDEGKGRNTGCPMWSYFRRRWWAYLLFVVPIGGVVYKVQDSWRNMPRPLSGPETPSM